jgi:signal transduction histidine kinase
VAVEVACEGDTLLVTVADDGVGGADAGGGSGLRGLRDRVDAVGGRMQVTSPPGEGTRLCARLPMHVLGAMYGH